jgi:ATP-dependent Clp endopeptidase proteolytic subunit ClpP
MATLRIYNDIASEDNKVFYQWDGTDAVCFKDIATFIAKIPANDDTIDMEINCRGGETDEGWAIYDALRSTGKTISATIVGECSSMATIVLLAAKKELRSGEPHAKLLIHNPYAMTFGPMSAEDMENHAADLKRERERFLDVYVERTGADRTELAAIMEQDRYMEMEEAQRLGFVTTILKPKSASTINKHREIMKPTVKEAFRMLSVALGMTSYAMELQTENGDKLNVERESGEPQVGDKATPDGEFVMPDGSTITVKDGVITDIKPAEKPDEKEPDGKPAEGEPTTQQQLEDALAQVEELKKKCEALEEDKKKCAKTADEVAILNAVAMAGGKSWLEQARSNYHVEPRQNAASSVKAEPKKQTIREYLAAKKTK